MSPVRHATPTRLKGTSLASVLSLPTLSPILQGLLHQVGSPKGQVTKCILGRIHITGFGPLRAPTCGRTSGELLWLARKAERGWDSFAKGRVAIFHIWLACLHCSQQQVNSRGFLFGLILGLPRPLLTHTDGSSLLLLIHVIISFL